ncbi:MAG: hypothetical protein WC655_27880, partial [Candidatus Hydrogenedentales bacterium]
WGFYSDVAAGNSLWVDYAVLSDSACPEGEGRRAQVLNPCDILRHSAPDACQIAVAKEILIAAVAPRGILAPCLGGSSRWRIGLARTHRSERQDTSCRSTTLWHFSGGLA